MFIMIKSMYRFSSLLLSYVLPLYLLFSYLIKARNCFVFEFSLMEISTISFPVGFVVDWVSVLFCLHVIIISFSVFWFAKFYMSNDPFFQRFIWLLFLFVVSMNILIFSSSLFILFLGWDGLGITSFLLIIYYSSKESSSAGFLTLLINRLGDVIIIGAFILFMMSGTFMTNYFSIMASSLLVLLTLAALTKSAQYPFSSWLPAAMAAPTPVSALVHSSTLVTAGVYLAIRLSLNNNLPELATEILLFCGAITTFLGGYAALYENDLKKMIALSTLSQLGVMMFSLGMGFTYLAYFHLLAHATFKAMLFMCAGLILMSTYGVQDLRLLGGVGKKMPLVMTFFNISSFCLVAFPFLNAFYTKHLILELIHAESLNLVSVLFFLLGSLFTGIYVIRTLKILFWEEPTINLSDCNFSINFYVPFVILGIMSIISGKLLYSMSSEFSEFVMVRDEYWYGLNLMLLLGLLYFIIPSHYKKNNLKASSLFFLSPVSYKSGFLMYPIMKEAKSLDSGWLEPSSVLIKDYNYYIKHLNNFFMWPNISGMPLGRSILLPLMLMILWLYL
uniref:NADH dehydrogenase subunit 5 n=1 Tax=Rabdotus mooreanus TaxID=3014811 RepID=UPI00286D20E7|nr:NADH dehydrogenase subunit 5 [Rabdotus mooreanus]WLN31333.1 NADH dehydrogenase subunit 5 [Rabdotus mooreanus]